MAAVLAAYGYEEMRVPVVEHTDLFKRAIGEYTDVVEKEMYTFTDQGGDSLTLRPEATAGMVRAAISNGLLRGARLKLWCQGPMFRHEKPQKGRYRQFTQIDVEAIGFAGPDVDVELIALTARLWKLLGLQRVKLQINSLGTPEARRNYRELLKQYFLGHVDAAGRGQQAPARRQPAAHPRQQDPGDAGHRGQRPGADRAPGRRIAGAFRRAAGRAGCHRRSLHGEPAPGARPRLLFAHGVRVDHRRAGLAGRGLFRRPLRRPDRPAGRRSDARPSDLPWAWSAWWSSRGWPDSCRRRSRRMCS